MRLRILVLFLLSGAMAWGGFQVSNMRAGAVPQIGEVLAQAGGGDTSFLPGAEGSTGENYHISALTIFSNVALHVKDNYVDPTRIRPQEMLLASLNEIERKVAEVLVEDLGNGKVRISLPGHQTTVSINDVESLWEINLKLREVFRFFEKYLPPQKDMRIVEYAAVNGALSTLDPHSILLEPQQFLDMKTSTKGEFGGLGIVISIKDAKLTIISPLEGTPASRAGLHALDVITRIGDVSTVSMPIEDAVNKLRGLEGSKVTIWVERKGWPEARKFTLVREKIKIESVESHLLEQAVGYVKVKNFQQNTGSDLDDQITKLEKKNGSPLKGIVLDLRNNPGGLLEQAIRVSDEFLSTGDIVTTVGYGAKLREPKRAQWSSSDLDTPLVVLVNNGSASASEIVAGALKNDDRAVIMGERTFGKGSVQVLYDFPDNSALKLTIAQYLTPGNVSIQSIGVTPDVELKQAWIEKNNVRLFWEPDAHREMDLDKHLERAKTPAGGNVPDPAEAKPEVKLTYLYELKKKDKKDADADGAQDGDEAPEDVPPPDGFEEDYPIKLAREMLAAAGKMKRSEMLRAASALLERRRQEEEVKIANAVSGLGVEWAAPETSEIKQKPNARVELRLTGTAADGRIVAGSEVSVEAKVTNTSGLPLYRLHGFLETEHPAFRGKEFLFGTLLTGATKTWTVSAKIPKEAASRSDILTLKLSCTGGPVDPDVQIPVMTQYVPHPQFAYSTSIDDSKKGDGDGVLERGEEVDLVVYVTNVGPGDADAVSLRLKSGAGEDLFLEKGRTEIGALKSGETRLGRLKFKVPARLTSSKPSLPLELTIYDAATGEWLEDEFSVVAQLPKPAKVVKKSGTGLLSKDTLVYASADPASDVLATLPKGTTVKYDAKVDDYLRVSLPDENFVWLKADDVKSGAGPTKKQVSLATLGFSPHRRPPTIEIDGQLGGRVVDTDSVSLTGVASGRSLRDMYIVLNDKKVFYKSPGGVAIEETDRASEGVGTSVGSAAPPAPTSPEPVKGPWVAPDDKAVQLPFTHKLTLNEGINKVLIVARLDEKVVTYRSLYLSRLKKPAPAVAEAAGPTKVNKPNAPKTN